MKLSRFLHLEAPRSGDAPPSVPPDRGRIEAVLAADGPGGADARKAPVEGRGQAISEAEPGPSPRPSEGVESVDRALIDLPFERNATPPREGQVQLIDDAADAGPPMDLEEDDGSRGKDARARQAAAAAARRSSELRRAASGPGPVRPPPELVAPLDEEAPYLLWIWQYASTWPVRISLVVVALSSLAILFLAGGPIGRAIGGSLCVLLFLGTLPRRWVRRLWPWVR